MVVPVSGANLTPISWALVVKVRGLVPNSPPPTWQPSPLGAVTVQPLKVISAVPQEKWTVGLPLGPWVFRIGNPVLAAEEQLIASGTVPTVALKIVAVVLEIEIFVLVFSGSPSWMKPAPVPAVVQVALEKVAPVVTALHVKPVVLLAEALATPVAARAVPSRARAIAVLIASLFIARQ
jgi:hypothetical protein